MADFIPDDQFIPDASRAPSAQGGVPSADFIPDASFVSDEEKYSGIVPGLKAAGLGAARSASFSLSDEALTRLGLMTPAELKAYKEQQPEATTIGEIGGVAGALLAPEVGVLGALSAPVRGVARVGQAVSEAIPAIGAAGPLGQILSKAAQVGAGSAVEGAFYGGGQSITEHALGDPDLNAEKVLANVGTAALVSGGIGATFGAGLASAKLAKDTAKRAFSRFISQTDKAAIDAGDFAAMAKNADIPEEEKVSFVKGLSKRKPNALQIEAAAKDLDAPVLPGMISDSKLVQKTQSSLLEGPPSYASLRAQSIANEGYTKAEAAAQGILGAESDLTKAGLGDHLKELVTQRIDEQVKPINELYEELKTKYEAIPANEKSVKQVARNIRKLDDVRLSPQAKAIAESAAERLEGLETIEDIKSLKTYIQGELSVTATPVQKKITGIIREKLADLEESNIVRFAENEMRTSTAKNKIMRILDERKAVNAQYAVFRDKIERLGEALGKKRIYGANDFLDFLDGLTPEKVAEKLSTKNNSKFLEWFSQEFPQGMESISQHQKGLIQTAAMRDGKLSLAKVISSIEKLPEEYRAKIFSPEELNKFNSLKTYTEAFPKNYNPSNTANMSALREFFTHPFGAVASNVRDSLAERFINASVKGGEEAEGIISNLATLEKSVQKTNRAVKSGINDIFSPSPARYYLATQPGTHEEHKKTFDKLNEYTANPDKLLNKLTEDANIFSAFAPKTSNSMQLKTTKAIQFLQQKIPTNNLQKYPLSRPHPLNRSDLHKWNRYFSVVENPAIALSQVAQGTLVPETMETLNTVFPGLLQEMRIGVLEKITGNKEKALKLPYRTKMSLSMFMDSDLVPSLNGVSILANQNTLANISDGNSSKMANQKRGPHRYEKLEESSRLLTPMQSANLRKES